MKIQYASDLHLEFCDNLVFLARGPFKVTVDLTDYIESSGLDP